METITAAAKLEELAAEAGEIAGTLAALENSLLFASERQDRDMTKPCAAAAHMIEGIVYRMQLDLMEISEALSRA